MPSKADEGMWLLQLMQEQHLADRRKAQGLLLEADDIYNPNRVSLKDAVGIFGGGCTLSLIHILPIHDTTAGFKCYRREVLETIGLDGIRFKGYASVSYTHLLIP